MIKDLFNQVNESYNTVKDQNAIVSILGHGALKTSIGIAKLKVIGNYKEKIGTPNDWNKVK